MSSLFRTKDGVPLQCMTVDEFCECLKISKSHFQVMQAAGKAPLMIRGLGKKQAKRWITRDAALAWVKKLEGA